MTVPPSPEALEAAIDFLWPHYADHKVPKMEYSAKSDSCRELAELLDKFANERAARRVAQAQQLQWRDIASAPKGEVFLYFPKKENDARGHNGQAAMYRVGRVSEYPFRKPTHWMPLPPAPSEK